jgi:hypothetical protein
MDCKTARLLLEFSPPGKTELPEADQAQLQQHLDSCPDCGPTARAERRLDEALGQAMRRVEVPDRLRDHLLHRLAAERNEWSRRRWGHAIRGLAIAAALLIAVWGVLKWQQEHRPAVDLGSLPWNADPIAVAWSPEQVEDFFAGQKVTMTAPRNLNYSYLVDARLARFQGQDVPMLLFVHGDQHARVFVLPARQFDLRHLTDDWEHTNSRCRALVRHREGDAYAYVFAYTGDNLAWLTQPSAVPL